jgi:hypothetical protein
MIISGTTMSYMMMNHHLIDSITVILIMIASHQSDMAVEQAGLLMTRHHQGGKGVKILMMAGERQLLNLNRCEYL